MRAKGGCRELMKPSTHSRRTKTIVLRLYVCRLLFMITFYLSDIIELLAACCPAATTAGPFAPTCMYVHADVETLVLCAYIVMMARRLLHTI